MNTWAGEDVQSGWEGMGITKRERFPEALWDSVRIHVASRSTT